MGDKRLIHDAAWSGATVLTELVKPEPKQERAFHRQAYQVIKAAIEGYEVLRSREEARLGPSRN